MLAVAAANTALKAAGSAASSSPTEKNCGASKQNPRRFRFPRLRSLADGREGAQLRLARTDRAGVTSRIEAPSRARPSLAETAELPRKHGKNSSFAKEFRSLLESPAAALPEPLPERTREQIGCSDDQVDTPKARVVPELPELAPLEPLIRSFAVQRAPELVASRAQAEPFVGLAPLLQRLVRRIAWADTGTRSALHIELGAGAFEGMRILVTRAGGELTLELVTPRHLPAAELAERLEARLLARGVALRAVRIRDC